MASFLERDKLNKKLQKLRGNIASIDADIKRKLARAKSLSGKKEDAAYRAIDKLRFKRQDISSEISEITKKRDAINLELSKPRKKRQDKPDAVKNYRKSLERQGKLSKKQIDNAVKAYEKSYKKQQKNKKAVKQDKTGTPPIPYEGSLTVMGQKGGPSLMAVFELPPAVAGASLYNTLQRHPEWQDGKTATVSVKHGDSVSSFEFSDRDIDSLIDKIEDESGGSAEVSVIAEFR